MALIDRDALIAKIRDDGILGNGYSDSEREDDVIDMIESCQIVDAKPVVHGEWIYDTPEHEFRIDGRNKFRCSNCGEVTDDTCMGRPRANFCQICGADMRKENDET